MGFWKVQKHKPIIEVIKGINKDKYVTLSNFNDNTKAKINKLCSFSEDIAEFFIEETTKEGLITPAIITTIENKFFSIYLDYVCSNTKCEHAEKQIKSMKVLKSCPKCKGSLFLMNEDKLKRAFEFYLSDLKFFLLESNSETIFLVYDLSKKSYLMKKGHTNLKDYLFFYLKSMNPQINLNFLKMYSKSNNIPSLMLDYITSYMTFNRVHDIGFMPVEDRVYYDDDKCYFNSFVGNKYLNLNKDDVPEDKKNIVLEEDCKHINLLLNTLVDRNQEHLNYLLEFISHKFQYPDMPLGKILIMYGEEQTGKSRLFWDKIINEIFKGYADSISQNYYEENKNFNDYFLNKILFNLDETKHNKDIEDELKNLVTASTISINGKFEKKKTQNKYFDLIAFSNNDEPLRVGVERGIYFRSKRLKKEGIYVDIFNNIPLELDNFVYYLLNMNPSKERLMKGLMTNAKMEVLEATKSIEDRFIDEMFSYETLKDFIVQIQDTHFETSIEILLDRNIKEGFIQYDFMLDCYNKFRHQEGIKYKTSLNKFAWFCNKLNINKEDKKQFKRMTSNNKKKVFYINIETLNKKFEEAQSDNS